MLEGKLGAGEFGCIVEVAILERLGAAFVQEQEKGLSRLPVTGMLGQHPAPDLLGPGFGAAQRVYMTEQRPEVGISGMCSKERAEGPLGQVGPVGFHGELCEVAPDRLVVGSVMERP